MGAAIQQCAGLALMQHPQAQPTARRRPIGRSQCLPANRRRDIAASGHHHTPLMADVLFGSLAARMAQRGVAVSQIWRSQHADPFTAGCAARSCQLHTSQPLGQP